MWNLSGKITWASKRNRWIKYTLTSNCSKFGWRKCRFRAMNSLSCQFFLDGFTTPFTPFLPFLHTLGWQGWLRRRRKSFRNPSKLGSENSGEGDAGDTEVDTDTSQVKLLWWEIWDFCGILSVFEKYHMFFQKQKTQPAFKKVVCFHESETSFMVLLN